jgi:hypothetical protein
MIPVLVPTIFMGTALDSATTAWVNQVVTNGGSVSGGRQRLINTMIVGLKSDGVWSLLDVLFVFAAENEPSALTDMKALTLGTNFGVVSFTTNRGYDMSLGGGGAVIQTGYNPGTFTSPQFTQNAATFFVWKSATGNNANVFVSATTGVNLMYPTYTDNHMYLDINSTTDDPAGKAVTPANGLYGGSRTTSTNINYYQNGTSVGSRTDTSVAVPSAQFIMQHQPPPYDVAFGAGGILSATDWSNLYSRLNTYLTAIGAN